MIVWFAAGIVALATGIMWGARSDVSFALQILALKALPVLILGGFESIAGAETGGRIDFRDTESVICANCHATMNHVAPLFGNFDENGQWSADIAVALPSDGAPLVVFGDWLPEGETTAWRGASRARVDRAAASRSARRAWRMRDFPPLLTRATFLR